MADMPQTATTGKIVVPYVNDRIFELKGAVKAAHRAPKRGRPCGRLVITDGTVTVTLAFAEDGKPAAKARRARVAP